MLKAQAVGGAEALERFMRESPEPVQPTCSAELENNAALTLVTEDLIALSADKQQLCGPLNFTLAAGERVALVGESGAGKTVLMNVLLGFLPYEGSLRVNGIELREMSRAYWQQHIAWLGQNPQLPADTLHDNIVMGSVMLATLVIMPPLFYRLGAPAGRVIAQQRASWRLQLMHWLSGQAELSIYGLSARWHQQLNLDERRWQDAQRQQFAGAVTKFADTAERRHRDVVAVDERRRHRGLACTWRTYRAGGVLRASCFRSAGPGCGCFFAAGTGGGRR